MSRRPVRLFLATSVIAVAASTLTGCAALEGIFPAQAERDPETQEIEESGQQDVFDVAVGDCFNDGSGAETEEIADIPAVPCDQPHDNEVFHLFDLTGDTFPADVDQLATDGCGAQFEAFVGLAYDASVFDFFPIQPTAQTWEQGDREVICSIYEPDVKSTGTLAGAAR
ncbi:MAG: hypothetical protein RI885_1936 [Actinomycetota bacterium]|jgi:hypothetical protein